MSQTIEERIAELGYELPEVAAPVANFLPLVRTGNQVFLSGQIPQAKGGGFLTGRLGDDVSKEDGQSIARQLGLQLLAVLLKDFPRLEDITRVLKINAYVNSTPDFVEQPFVTNGCSDLMVEVWGERGKHARAAIGVASLPLDVPIEIDALFEVRDETA